MKKVIIVALTLVASASLSTAHAADKNKNKKKQVVAPAVVLQTPADSLSYAVGYDATNGLVGYIQQSFGVDTAYMADFVEGFKAAINDTTARAKARMAGAQIAAMVNERILPNVKHQYESSYPVNNNLFIEGFTAALKNDKSLFDMQKANNYKTNLMKAKGEKFLAENAKKSGVKVLPDGLQYKVLTQGTGETPKKEDEVEVIYEGRLIDGTVFDATYKHPGNEQGSKELKPDQFGVSNLIKGWTEVLTMMPVGSKWEIYIPNELAYGSRPAGMIPPYSALVFTMELKGIVKPKVEEPAPAAEPAEKTSAAKDTKGGKNTKSAKKGKKK